MSTDTPMNGILSGMRVVEGSAFIAAPLGGMTLAQMGADVIRFDNIGGGLDAKRSPLTEDGNSIYWAGWNKGKRSIMIDLRADEGRELVSELITAPGEDNGLFLTNLPMRGWLDYETLRQRRDDLIALSIIGSSDGRNAIDYTANAATGLPYVNGPTSDQAPLNNPLPVWDMLTGNAAATGLLAAERYRVRTGKGQLIRLALTDIALAAVANMGVTAEIEINGNARGYIGNDIYGTYGRDFATFDGRRIMVVAVTKRMWSALVAATGLGDDFDKLAREHDVDLANEQVRYELREPISAILEPWFRQRSLADIAAVLTDHGACWEAFQTFSQMMSDDPRFSEDNPMFEILDQPGIGRYLAPGSPLAFGAQPRLPVRPAPVLGQHTNEILSEILGLPDHAIGKLHDSGIVADAEHAG
jgi:2-methylfumaryl-CoA isomerase